MKTTLFSLLMWLALVVPAAASQDTQEPRDQVQARLDEIKDRLELTPEQMEQLRPILTEEAQKLRALRDKYGAEGSKSRRRERAMARELRDIRSDADKKLARILSRSQMDELKKLREAQRRELRDRTR